MRLDIGSILRNIKIQWIRLAALELTSDEDSQETVEDAEEQPGGSGPGREEPRGTPASDGSSKTLAAEDLSAHGQQEAQPVPTLLRNRT